MLAAIVAASSVLVPSIIPRPAVIEATGGALVLKDRVILRASAGAEDATGLLRALLTRSTKLEVNPRHKLLADIQLTLDPNLAGLGDEGYQLDVTPQQITAKAAKPAGLFYAAQSIRQMLPAELETGRPFALAGERVSCVHIEDRPRFSWRGMHLDESRHFYGIDAVKKYIDLLAMNKMNVFHWHLVDDGGWRIEIKKYPKLTDVGAWRKGTGKGWDYINIDFAPNNGKTQVYGGFYTQDQVREIVDYAKHRFVQVVPEIEMPGHALPAPYNYNEVGCDPASIDAWKKATGMRYGNVYCAGKEATYTFIQNVLDEVIALFPSQFVHIGGDEVDKRLWHACATCQAKMADEHLKDEGELQSYFVKRIEKYLNSKGKRMIGWDEILEGGLAPNATVMSWRGISGGIEAAKSGHDVVMSPTSHCYFDYPYSGTSTELVYSYDPVPAELNDAEGKRVMGAQGNVWTEWMETFERVEKMSYPRACALAEAVWTPKEEKRWADFEGRLGDMYKRLALMNVNFNLPEPAAKLDAIVFRDTAKVAFDAPPFDGAVLRYSVDGQVPTANSPIYKGPIVVDKTSIVYAALFVGKVSSTPIAVSCVKAGATQVLPNAKPGLVAKVRFGAFAKVSDMASVAVSKSYPVSNFDIKSTGVEDRFGISFEGYIMIPTDGIYAFSTTSDDGSVLKIGGATVVNNDGLHGSVEKTGKVFLPAGMYPFSLDFFEAGGAESLTVTVTPPDGPRMPIPTSWLGYAGQH